MLFPRLPLFASPLLDAAALAINNHGVVVGYSYDQLQRPQAVIFESNGVVTLGALPGDNSSSARCLNDRGHIAGLSDLIDEHGFSRRRGFLLRDGEMIDLGSIESHSTIFVEAINEGDDIVGIAEDPLVSSSDGWVAFIFTGGQIRDLNSRLLHRSPWRIQTAFDINEAGCIVGTATHDGQHQAVLLTPVPEHRPKTSFRRETD